MIWSASRAVSRQACGTVADGTVSSVPVRTRPVPDRATYRPEGDDEQERDHQRRTPEPTCRRDFLVRRLVPSVRVHYPRPGPAGFVVQISLVPGDGTRGHRVRSSCRDCLGLAHRCGVVAYLADRIATATKLPCRPTQASPNNRPAKQGTEPTMTRAHTPNPLAGRSLRVPVLWGVVFGGLQAAAPLGFWWLDAATVYALSLVLIAAVYIGFAVADGRPRVIAVEAGIAGAFVVVAAAGVTGPAWLLVLGLTVHGFKDLWQHRRHFVANTRWWPSFCLVVDWVAAAILVVLITVGVDFHR
jgi:hypothetical protein